MKYVLGKGVIKSIKTKVMSFGLAVVLTATSMSGAAPFLIQKASALGGNIVINEMSTFSSSDWVELYNTTGGNISIGAYTLHDADAHSKTSANFSATTISAHGFVIVDFGNLLNKDGDTVTLSDGTNVIDTVSYGDHFVSGNEGIATAPANNAKTVSRTWDGGSTWALQADTQDITNGAAPVVAQPVLSTTYPATATVNEQKSFTTSINKNGAADTMVRVKTVLDNPSQATSAALEYETAVPGVYSPLTFDGSGVSYFGANVGFPLSDATTNMHVTFNAAGTYGATIEIVKASDDSILGTPIHTSVVVSPVMPPAATTTTVTAANTHNWSFVDDNGNGGAGSYVAGPSGSTGNGSAQLEVNATNQGYLLAKTGSYGGTKLADILNLSYKTYVQTGNNLIAPSVQLDVDNNVTDGASTWQGRLVYEPYQNGTVTDGQWQTWNTAAGKWWLTKPASFPAANCGQATPCTFAQLAAAYPNIGLSNTDGGHVGMKAGSSWTSFKGNVDSFQFATASVNDVYDFEPDTTKPTATLTEPTANSYNPTQMVVVAHDKTSLNKVTANIYDQAGTTLLKSCSQNAGSAMDFTATCVVPTTLADGAYTIRANASDMAGHTSSTTTRQFIIDHTAPTGLANLSPSDNTFTTTAHQTSIDWTDATDPHGPISYYYESSDSSAVNGDGSFVSPVYQSGALTTSQIATNNTPAGVYYWHVRAVDAATNSSAWTDAWKITVDNTKPVVAFTNPTDFSAPFMSGPNVAVTASDNGSGLAALVIHAYKANGSAAKFCTASASDLAAGSMSCDLSGLVSGTYYIKAGAADKSGNNTTILSGNFVIDTDAPSVPVNGAPHNAYEKTNEFDFTWDASTDNQPGAITYEYVATQNPDQTSGVLTNDLWHSGALTTNMIHSSGAGNGVWYWQVRARDAAGNYSAWSQVWNMTIDSVSPTVSITFPANHAFERKRFTIVGDADDSLSDIDRVKIFVTRLSDGTKIVDNERATYDTLLRKFTYDVSGLENGETYKIRTVALDKAGNKTVSNIVKFTVDNTKPDVTITDPGTVSNNVDFFVSGTASDAGSGLPTDSKITVKFKDAAGNVLYSHKAKVRADGTWKLKVPAGTLMEGAVQIIASVRDNLGFKGIATSGLIVDNTAPAITVNNYAGTDTTPTLTGTVNDNVAAVTVSIDGTAVPGAINNGDGTWTLNLTTPLSVSSHSIIATATDAVGNHSAVNGNLTITQVVTPAAKIKKINKTNSPTTQTASNVQTTGNTFTPQVLGASTTPTTGHVLGDKTTDGNNTKTPDTKKFATAADKAANLLGITWYWWVLIVLAILGALFAAYRRANTDDKRS